MTKTIYYETARNGLIPCEFLGWAKTPAHETTGLYNAVIRLKRGKAGYETGEVLHVPPFYVVVKSHVQDYHQYVKPAELPPVNPETVAGARC